MQRVKTEQVAAHVSDAKLGQAERNPNGGPIQGTPIRIALMFVNYGPYHLARALALMPLGGIEPYFIELAASQKKYPWLADKRKLLGRLITLTHKAYEQCSSREIARKAVAALERLRPAVVVIAGYNHRPMRAAAAWARRNGRGVVLLSETAPWDFPRSWWREALKRAWIRRYVDAALVGGQPQRAYAASLGVDPARIWDRYNVVDNEHFAKRCEAIRAEGAAQRIQAGLPEYYFLYVGRFVRQKNLPLLLRAYRRYRELCADPWRLVLVGDGPLRNDLVQIARDAGLNDIVWAGFKQSDDLPLYYAFANCFVMASILEPWGLVVNEAMASGLPVLVSRRCGCATDLVQPGNNGFIFEPGNPDELARLMLDISARSAQQLGSMGRASRMIIARWTPEAWADQLACAVQAASKPGEMLFPSYSEV